MTLESTFDGLWTLIVYNETDFSKLDSSLINFPDKKKIDTHWKQPYALYGCFMVIIIYAFKVQTMVKSATATRNTENCKYNCFAGKLHDTHIPCQERPITVHVVIITNKRKRCVCSLPLQFNFIFFLKNFLLEQVHYISCIFWQCSISGKHLPTNSIRLQMLYIFIKFPNLTVICQHNVVLASARIFSLSFLPCTFYLLHVINSMISQKVCFIFRWFTNSLG